MSRLFFSRNEHITDRAIRVVIGVGALSMAVAGPQHPLGWLGLVPLVTGLVGTCPLYSLFGVSTCRVR
jgi:hypothetical protein